MAEHVAWEHVLFENLDAIGPAASHAVPRHESLQAQIGEPFLDAPFRAGPYNQRHTRRFGVFTHIYYLGDERIELPLRRVTGNSTSEDLPGEEIMR